MRLWCLSLVFISSCCLAAAQCPSSTSQMPSTVPSCPSAPASTSTPAPSCPSSPPSCPSSPPTTPSSPPSYPSSPPTNPSSSPSCPSSPPTNPTSPPPCPSSPPTSPSSPPSYPSPSPYPFLSPCASPPPPTQSNNTAPSCPGSTPSPPSTGPNCPPNPYGLITNGALEAFLTNVLYTTLRGSTSGVNLMDPLSINSTETFFATFQFSDTNTNVTGLSRTTITSLKISADYNMTAFKLIIPSFSIKSDHNVSGYILYLPSNGSGTVEIDYGTYSMKVYAQLIQLTGPNNCTYLQFGNFSVDPRALAPVRFNLTPLYDNTGADVTAQRNLFMDQNWQDMAYFVQDPKAEPIIQALLTYANNYLITYPINNYLNMCP